MIDRMRRRLSPIVGLDSGGRIGRLRRNLRDRRRWPWHAMLALANRRPAALNVQLMTTSACNGKCAMCPYLESWHRHNPGQMSDELFESIIDQLRPMKLAKLCLYHQNEPLLDPKFLDRLAKVRQQLRFKKLEISTNASALTEKTAKALADLLEGVGHEIWISFHGVDKESYEENMGLDFDRVLGNILILLKLSQERNLKIKIRSAGASVAGSESFSPVHFGARQMEAFWEGIFDAHGIRHKPGLTYLAYHNRAGSLGRDGSSQPAARRSLAGFYCVRADKWLHVLYNGDVVLCCNDYHRRTVIGNLREQGVSEVLVSPKFRQYRLMVMGLKKSSDNFLCKLCGKPPG